MVSWTRSSAESLPTRDAAKARILSRSRASTSGESSIRTAVARGITGSLMGCFQHKDVSAHGKVKTKSMPVAAAKDSLKKRGIRLTRQRQLLMELLDQSGKHLDAETLYQMAHEKDPKLNRVTVYRTLKMLKEGGLVDELDLMHYGGDQHYYETKTKQEHAHIICLRCGKVEEFFGDPLARLRRQVESHFGFQILIARTEVGGYCAHCQVLRAQEFTSAGQDRPAATNESARISSHRPRKK